MSKVHRVFLFFGMALACAGDIGATSESNAAAMRRARRLTASPIVFSGPA
jgi:hypothetical protein